MKRLTATFGFLASLATLASMPGTAAAQSVGDIYWGLFGAAQFNSDNDINDDVELDYDTGFAFGGQLGYIFGSVRAEAEVEYSEVDADIDVDNNNNNNDLDTQLSIIRGTGSLYFDFIGFNQSDILPYAGGGFGLASLNLSDDIDDDELALTAHGEIGVSFAASAGFDVVASYRFEYYDSDVGNIDDDITAHQVRMGIRFFPRGCC